MKYLLAFFMLLGLGWQPATAQTGTSMYDAFPVNINACYGGSVTDYQYTPYFYDNYGNPSPDVWYTFTLAAGGDVSLSTCGSDFDTYLWVLDEYGNVIVSDDDWGCGGGTSEIYQYLSAGTYYVVAEGSGYASGNLAMYLAIFGSGTPASGANMSYAINAGSFSSSGTYTDTRSNADDCLGNDIGQPSNDIYYTFTLSGTANVTINHCGSGFDTYMHVLDAYGNTVAINDDSSVSPCPGSQAYIETTLSAGTYYVVSEGFYSNTGNIVTNIGISMGSAPVPVISYTSSSTFTLGAAITPLSPTNTGGAVSAAGQSTITFAGGSQGSANGTGTAAQFDLPASVAVDASGNVYVGDSNNNRVRKITPAGVVSTLAGSGTAGGTDGTGTGASFNHPAGVAVDASGNVFVSDQYSHTIRKITPAGVVSTFINSGAGLNNPLGLVFDQSGNLYVADYANNLIRKITPAGVLSTLAGSGATGFADGTGTAASFNRPMGLAIDASGNIYVGDRLNHRVRKISPAGVVTTLAGSGTGSYADGAGTAASFNRPCGVAVDASGNVLVTDELNAVIRKIDPLGNVTTFAGSPSSAFIVDGNGSAVRFSYPYSIAMDATGNAYIAELTGHAIRKMTIAKAYSISPALPAGLVFNENTGTISGTPTAVSAAATYTVTAYNSYGSGTATLSMEIIIPCLTFSQDQNYVVTYSPRQSGITNMSSVLQSSCDQTKVQTSVQYLDGLGRQMQIVQVKGNGDGTKDLIQPVAYDVFGDESLKYLPYATNSGLAASYRPNALVGTSGYSNSAQKTFYSLSGQGYKDITNPYSVTVLERSPLKRIIEQGAPGSDWQPVTNSTSGHTQKIEYGANIHNEVLLWKVNSTGASALQAYPANKLYKTINKDENWTAGKAGTIEEFKDFRGRIVLKRIWEDNSTSLSTYYVYDNFGNLRYVVPPVVNVSSFTETDAVFGGYIYAYRYDGRNRLTEKKVPGKGWEYMVYNKLDQVVMSQDAVQRGKSPQEWMLTKYDAFGRTVLAGIYEAVGSNVDQNYRTVMQNNVDAQVNQWESKTAIGSGYTSVTYPAMGKILTMSYYDSYNTGNTVTGFPTHAAYNQSASYSAMITGLPVATATNVIGTNHYLWNVNYYDNKGRLEKSVQQHYKGTGTGESNYDEIGNSYSFTGELNVSIRKHYVAGAENLYVKNEYRYDHMGRKTDIYQTTGSTSATTNNSATLLTRNVYNEIGQLRIRKLHSIDNGASFAQEVSYSYNERGWLNLQWAPLFSQTLRYQEVLSGTTPQYNGNISRQEWGSGKYYNYNYDKLGRLSTAISNAGNNEAIGYDIMGNISRLQRSLGGSLIDQIRYDYANENKLSSVLDSNSNVLDTRFQLAGTTNYTFDANGNMISRYNGINVGNNIVDITYSYLNLPETMNVGGNSLTYTYDATGDKLRKQFAGISNNDYISGIHYENGVFAFVQTETGRATKNGSGADPVYKYEYTLSDHLGNGRAYFDIDNGVARKIQELEYYAFGLGLDVSPPAGTENKYQYNGKEKQDELKMFDHGARFYDPIIARWTVVDPLAEQMRRYSPYTFVYNNPMRFVDSDGMKGDDWVAYDVDGKSYAKWDNDVVDQRSATKKYGLGALYLGQNAAVTTASGYKLHLNSDGTKEYDAPVINTGDNGTSLAAEIRRLMPVLNLAEGIATVSAMAASSGIGSAGSGTSFLLNGIGRRAAFMNGLNNYISSGGGYSTIFRAVSAAEVDDIAQFGFRVMKGGYESKLFAPTLKEAVQYGRYNFGLDGIPNIIMKVTVPNSVLNGAHRFGADGMNAIDIAAKYLNSLKGIPLNVSPIF